MGSFKPTLAHMQSMLALEDIALDSLPQDLLNRWIGLDGSWRLLVYARDDLADINALRRFVNEVSAYVTANRF